MSTIKAENAPHGGAIVTTSTAPTTTAASATPFSTNIGSGPFQLTAVTAPSSTTITSTTTTRNNISVTNIKCEADDLRMCTTTTTTAAPATTTPINGNLVPVIATNISSSSYFNGATGIGIRIPVPKAEDSDSEAELTNIENLKVTRRTSGSGSSSIGATCTTQQSYSKNGPRPMSWEGELSEPETTETDLMETENSVSNDKQYMPQNMGMTGVGGGVGGGVAVTSSGLTVIKSEATTTTPAPPTTAPPSFFHQQQHHHHHQHHQHQRHAGIKPEMEQISVEILSAQSTLITPYQKIKLTQQPLQSDPINLKYEPGLLDNTPTPTTTAANVNSPLLARNKSSSMLPANPSPDSAIHSVYTHSSPSQSPLTSRHAPYTPSLSRNNSDASHSSCYSYSSEFSPTHSPIQGRHSATAAAAAAAAAAAYSSFNGGTQLHHSVLYRPISIDSPSSPALMNGGGDASAAHNLSNSAAARARAANAGLPPECEMLLDASNGSNLNSSDASIPSPGISRQQLINSPCPICGDKISGFHYGIFSCESCKGFFKRTVQNRKNYVCVRGGPCPVSISTRKKCPACRFEKCLQKGMKLEAIREDRTRGGRSTYQCSYTLPNSMLSPLLSPDQQGAAAAAAAAAAVAAATAAVAAGGACGAGGGSQHQQHQRSVLSGGPGGNGYITIKTEHGEHAALNGIGVGITAARPSSNIPVLLQEIMDVEHLWQYNEAELARLNQPLTSSSSSSSSSSAHHHHHHSSTGSSTTNSSANQQISTNPLLASAGLSSNGENANPDLIAHLCNVADHRLYKIVKWCKSLPLFKNISIDDQICLLINSWCELLLFSCCYRSIDTPGEIKMSQGKKINLAQAKTNGLQACIERMLNLTDHLRRLRVDRYEYVAMKVIVLLQSDTSELQEPVKVRECQEKALQSLQAYTLAHYPDTPSKFGELLLRIPDLQRTCQLGKEMLTIKSRDGGDFNLLMELLRGEH